MLAAGRLCSAFVTAALLVTLEITGGCASPAAPVAPAISRASRIELVNVSECDWRIAVAAAGSGERILLVGAHETQRLEFAGGDYTITQTALSGLAGAELTRQFSARLAPGEVYRWRLATLIAAPAGVRP